jgi:ferredoxin
VCAPTEMAMTATRTLTAHRVPAERIHRELFVAPTRFEFAKDAAVVSSTVTVTLGRATTQMTTAGDEALLEAALRAGIDAPYSCTGGACGTCKAKLLTGAVHMEHNYALTEDDVADGWILTCQSRPTTELIHIDYGAKRCPASASGRFPETSGRLTPSDCQPTVKRSKRIGRSQVGGVAVGEWRGRPSPSSASLEPIPR